MKLCPRCNNSHEKPGTFCSRKCANSRTFSEESRIKKSKAADEFYKKHGGFPSKFKGSVRPVARTEKQLKTHASISIERFQNGLLKDNSTIKKVLSALHGYKCELCGIYEWQGTDLILDLDHIDGNNKNNIPSNVRLLCPNCHRQTLTWGNRTRK